MKRDLSVITDEVRELIISWLGTLEGHDEECPFDESGIECSTCRAIFPKLKLIRKNSDSVPCPCDAFQIPYVIKIAKEIIK